MSERAQIRVPRSAPGRLAVRAEIDRFRVDLPPHLAPLTFAYQAFCLLAVAVLCAVVAWTEPIFSLEDLGFLALGSLFLLATLQLPLLFTRAAIWWLRLESPVPRWRVVTAGLAALPPLVALSFALAMPVPDDGEVQIITGLLAALAAASLLHYAAAVFRAQQRIGVTIRPGTLEIERGRRRWAFSLEEAGDLEPLPGRFARVRIGGVDVPALAGLTDPERAWLAAVIRAAAQGQQAALERQGHDLAEPATPQALLDLARR